MSYNQYQMPTALFIRRPNLWIYKISEHRITTSVCPNFGYQYLLSSFKADKNIKLDLSSVEIILNGAEPINAQLQR